MVNSAHWLILAEHPMAILTVALFLEWLLPLPVGFRPSALVPLFERLARKVNAKGNSPSQQWIAGLLAPLVILVPLVLALWSLRNLSFYEPLFDLLLLLWLLEAHPLKSQSLIIERLLKSGKSEMARLHLSRWVKRDTHTLSAMGTAKAASEMIALRLLAQWFGVAFWYLAAGIYGAFLFRFIQLLAQAFSIKRPVNRLFGELTHRLFNLLLLPPAIILALTLGCFPGGGRAIYCLFSQTKSWPALASGAFLASLAGSLDLQLGGPRLYDGEMNRLKRIGWGKEPDATSPARVRKRLGWLGFWLWSLLVLFFVMLMHARHLF